MSDKNNKELKRRPVNLTVDTALANEQARERRIAAKRAKEKKAVELTGDETVLIGAAEPHRLQLPVWPTAIGTTDGDETQPFVDTPTVQSNYEKLISSALRPAEDTKRTSQPTVAEDTRGNTKKRKRIETKSEVNKPSGYTRHVSFPYASQNKSSSEPATENTKPTDESTKTDGADKCIIN